MKSFNYLVKLLTLTLVVLLPMSVLFACSDGDDDDDTTETPTKIEPKISLNIDPPEAKLEANGEDTITMKLQVLLSNNNPAEGIPLTLTCTQGWFKYDGVDTKIILNAPLKAGRFEVEFIAYPEEVNIAVTSTIKALASVEDRVVNAEQSITITPCLNCQTDDDDDDITDDDDDACANEDRCENNADCSSGKQCCSDNCCALVCSGDDDDDHDCEPCSITLAADPDLIKGDGLSTSTIQAVVCNGNGELAQGRNVDFTIVGSGEFLDSTTATSAGSNNGGIAEVKIRSIPHTEGQATVQGAHTCDSGTGTGAAEYIGSVTVVVEPEDPPPATIEVRANPSLILANKSDTSEIVTLVRAADGAPLETKVTCETTKGVFVGTNRQKEERWSDQNGMAEFSLLADALPGVAQITCYIEVPNNDGNLVTVLGTTSVRMVSLGQLVFTGANPDRLGLVGSGNENSRVCFQLIDGDGSPIDSINLEFSLTDAPGEPSIYPESNPTDTSGNACTTLNTGKVPTTVQVQATAVTGTATLKASSPSIVIAGGKPSAKYFNFNCVASNVGGLSLKFASIPCIVSVADRFSNELGSNVPVFFRTEAGTIDAASYTENEDNGIGSTAAYAYLVLNEPYPRDVNHEDDWGEPYYEKNGKEKNPRDGLVTLIAATTGEEEFDDENGNGVYDLGEKFVDLAEPFVDSNDDGIWNSDEEFIDINGNSIWDGPNGQWDGDTIIWAPAFIMWTGDMIANSGGCVQKNEPEHDQLRVDDQLSLFCPTTYDVQDADLDPNVLQVGNGGTREIFYQVRDANLNPPNMSTTICFNTDPKLATLENADCVNVPDLLGLDVQEVISCPVDPKICERRYEFTNFLNGYRGNISAIDADPYQEAPRGGSITLEANYLSVPSAIGVSGEVVSSQPEKKLIIPLSTKMDVSDVVGPCSMSLDVSTDNAPADGKFIINISARARDEKDNPLSADKSSIRLAASHGRFAISSSNTAIIAPDNTGSIETQYIVPNSVPEDNEVLISAGFTCDGLPITRERTILLYEDVPTTASITLSMSKQTVVADGSDYIEVSALVTDETGKKVPDGTGVTFIIRTPAGALLFVDPNNPGSDNEPSLWLDEVYGMETTNGVTETLKLKGGGWEGCNAGIIEIEARSSQPPASDTQLVKAIKMGSLKFEKEGAPDYLTVFGSGLKETAFVTFTLNDTNGDPFSPKTPEYSGQKVTFSLQPSASASDPSPANPQLLVGEAFTDSLGRVSTLVKSGTTATNFIVKARAAFESNFYKTDKCEDPDIVGQSEPIPIVGAVPSARYMTFECPTVNVPGLTMNFFESKCILTLADRFSNKIGVPTNVNYRIEAGSIDPFSSTPDLSEVMSDPDLLGKTETTYRTGFPVPLDVPPQDSVFLESREPYYIAGVNIGNNVVSKVYNPRDGLVTIIAATTGEEEFFDSNGNGQWDWNEYFVDLPEPFVDSNDNNKQDANEMFLDANGDTVWNYGNGVWDEHTLIWTSFNVLWTGKVSTPWLPTAKGGVLYGDKRFGYTAEEMCKGKINIHHTFFDPADKNAWPEGFSVDENMEAESTPVADRCRLTLPTSMKIFRESDVGTLYVGLADKAITPKIVAAPDRWFKVMSVRAPNQVDILVSDITGTCNANQVWDWTLMSSFNDSGNSRTWVCTDGDNSDPFAVSGASCDEAYPSGECHHWEITQPAPDPPIIYEHEVPYMAPYYKFQVPPNGSDYIFYGILDERLNFLNSFSSVDVTLDEAVEQYGVAALSGETSVEFGDSLGMDIEYVSACGTDEIKVFDPSYVCPLDPPTANECNYICRTFKGIGNFAHNYGRDSEQMFGRVLVVDGNPSESDDCPDAMPYFDTSVYINTTVPIGTYIDEGGQQSWEYYPLIRIVEGAVD